VGDSSPQRTRPHQACGPEWTTTATRGGDTTADGSRKSVYLVRYFDEGRF
jgi:hypothetical protein